MTPTRSLTEKFQNLGRQGAIYGLGSVVEKAAMLILLPIYTAALATEEYGKFALMLLIGQIGGGVAALGLRAGMVRSFYDGENFEDRKVVISTVVYLTAASGAVFLSLGLVFSPVLCRLFLASEQYAGYLRLVIGAAMAQLFIQIAFTLFRLQHRPTLYVTFQLFVFVARVAAIVCCVTVLGLGLYGAVLGQLIAASLSALVLLWSQRACFTLHFSHNEAGKLLRYGAPLLFSAVFGLVANSIDRFLIAFYLTYDEVGIYSVGYQLAMVMVVLMVSPLKLVWGPAFLSVKDDANFREFCSKSLTYVVLVGGLMFLGVALLSKEALRIIAPENYWGAYQVVPILALSYLISGTRSIFEVGALLKRKTTVVATYLVFGGIVNLALNVVLIPRFGILGAAYATFCAFLGTIVYSYFSNARLMKIDYEWARIFQIGSVFAILFLIGSYPRIDRVLVSIAYKSAVILLYPCALLALGVLRRQEIHAIKNMVISFSR